MGVGLRSECLNVQMAKTNLTGFFVNLDSQLTSWGENESVGRGLGSPAVESAVPTGVSEAVTNEVLNDGEQESDSFSRSCDQKTRK